MSDTNQRKSSREVEHLNSLLTKYIRNLEIIEEQIALHGGAVYSPVETQNLLYDTKKQIEKINNQLFILRKGENKSIEGGTLRGNQIRGDSVTGDRVEGDKVIVNLRLPQIHNNKFLNTSNEGVHTEAYKKELPDITTLVLRDKESSNERYTYIFIFMTLAAFILYAYVLRNQSLFSWNSLSMLIAAFLPAIATSCLLINTLAIKYRIRKGYYGTTSSEAKEIIEFILDHVDDPDFPSGKEGKIFPDAESILSELRPSHGQTEGTL